MLRFVGGCYDFINGGYVASITQIFSGGIFDIYYSDLAIRKFSHHPDADELFTIFEHALKHNNLIECTTAFPKDSRQS